MSFVSLRRAMPVCIGTAAALALAVPGAASAHKVTPPNPEVLEQCSGAQSIESEGSTFQAPAEFVLSGENSETSVKTGTGFNVSSSPLACAGLAGQGSGEKPVVKYNQANALNRGSGSCLKTWGKGVTAFGEEKTSSGLKDKYPRVSRYPFCGTDEAPSKSVKEEFEKPIFTDHVAGFESGEGEAVETIPVAQGAEAIVTHLPKDCTAKSEIETPKGKKEKLGRLALDQEVIEEIYRGTIKTWSAAIAKQGTDGNDVLTCTEGGEGDTISPVVRADSSGTTHIFKEFLAQVYTGNWAAESFTEVNGGADKGEKPCTSGNLGAGATESWATVGEGCENQRWPEAANVLFANETGNQGVLKEVNAVESSIGYADLAFAREKGYFSKKGVGGENKKEEQKKEFWAVVQNSKPGVTPVTFTDPSTKGDKEKSANSNCKDTRYIAKPGEEVPPPSTRSDWSKVRGENISETYPICGLTYALAARQYFYFLQPYFAAEGKTEAEAEAKALQIATTVHDYLQWVVNTKSGGGGKVLKNSDYEALPKAIQAEAEFGAEEIGSKIA